MHVKNAIIHALDWTAKILQGSDSDGSAWRGVAVVLVVGLAGIAAHIWLHGLVIWAHATLLVIAVLLAAIGFRQVDQAVDTPIDKLIANGNCANAPFMFAKAVELYRRLEPQRAKAALELFLGEVTPLRGIGELSVRVADSIYLEHPNGEVTHRSVWAVCGRKDRATARTLYRACEQSLDQGSHIERVFFPPDSIEDEKDIHDAIERHLRARMTVRAFESREAALATLYEFHLPRGFGMTCVGACTAGEPRAVREPDRSACASGSMFVHWGGLGGADHNGVFLQENEDWAEHLFSLCRAIHRKAKVANADPRTGLITPMTLNAFLKEFPHYQVNPPTDE